MPINMNRSSGFIEDMSDWVARAVFVEIVRNIYVNDFKEIELSSGVAPKTNFELIQYFERLSSKFMIDEQLFLPTEEISSIILSLNSLLGGRKDSSRSKLSEVFLMSPSTVTALVLYCAGYEIKQIDVKIEALNKLGYFLKKEDLPRLGLIPDIQEKVAGYIDLVKAPLPAKNRAPDYLN